MPPVDLLFGDGKIVSMLTTLDDKEDEKDVTLFEKMRAYETVP